MKKILYSALALPLLFACSSEDFDKEVISNNQFAGIEKVDATFSMAEASTRMATDWALEEGDQYGFAWLGGGAGANAIAINGNAYQNHPLTQTGGIFKPATSIYVGSYFLYRPYDETVVDIEKINFNSLKEQTITDGMGGDSWRALAKNAIIIGDKFTNVTKAGTPDAEDPTFIWDKAGINQHYNIYAAIFSNQTGLEMTYKNNDVDFGGKKIKGATDIDYTYPASSPLGAAEIYGGTVDFKANDNEAGPSITASSFQYAPTAEANVAAHDGKFWETQSNVGAKGFTFDNTEPITLTTGNSSIPTEGKTKGWIWFNSLPVTIGNGDKDTYVHAYINTSFGVVKVKKALKDCAYAYEDFTGKTSGEDGYAPEWIKLGTALKNNTNPKEWNFDGTQNTFVNQYGNHKGKFAFDVDFAECKIGVMDIKNDAHLQKALKFYIATGGGYDATLNLDAEADGNFKISKISIALLQTINAAGPNTVKVQGCGTHTPDSIIITQEGQAAMGLADKTEVPALNNVFAAATDVYLSKDYTWTWSGRSETPAEDYKAALAIDANVTSITNEGTLTVNATNVQLSIAGKTLANDKGATMNITKVTTVKNALTNRGIINVGSASNTAAELRAYAVDIVNDATALDAYGEIYNYGVVGVTAGTTPAGKFNNYGYIKMMSDKSITLLSSNEKNANGPTYGPFKTAFVAGTNVLGVVELPEGKPNAIVSINNAAENGCIKYNWTGATYSTQGGVKYNTLIISQDIKFNSGTEVQFIEFKGERTQVVGGANLGNLRGIYVHPGKSIIIEKGQSITCKDGAYLAPGATVYQGGTFTYPAGGTTNYYGTWSTDQIVKY